MGHVPSELRLLQPLRLEPRAHECVLASPDFFSSPSHMLILSHFSNPTSAWAGNRKFVPDSPIWIAEAQQGAFDPVRPLVQVLLWPCGTSRPMLMVFSTAVGKQGRLVSRRTREHAQGDAELITSRLIARPARSSPVLTVRPVQNHLVERC